jgi:hypothetical protein
MGNEMLGKSLEHLRPSPVRAGSAKALESLDVRATTEIAKRTAETVGDYVTHGVLSQGVTSRKVWWLVTPFGSRVAVLSENSQCVATRGVVTPSAPFGPRDLFTTLRESDHSIPLSPKAVGSSAVDYPRVLLPRAAILAKHEVSQGLRLSLLSLSICVMRPGLINGDARPIVG